MEERKKKGERGKTVGLLEALRPAVHWQALFAGVQVERNKTFLASQRCCTEEGPNWRRGRAQQGSAGTGKRGQVACDVLKRLAAAAVGFTLHTRLLFACFGSIFSFLFLSLSYTLFQVDLVLRRFYT